MRTRTAAPFFGGLPTSIDVKKLDEKYGVPDVGRIFSHEEIAETIGQDYGSDRYRTVLIAWRKSLRKNHNVDTDAVIGEGIKVLDMMERADVSARDLKFGVRRVRGSAIRASMVDESKIADPHLRARASKTKEVTARITMMVTSEVRALTPPRPPAALPRVAEA